MDPATMTDEQLDAAIDGDNTNSNPVNPAGDPGAQDPTPPPADPAPDEGTGEPAPQEPQGDPEPQHQPDEPKPPSRREQLRIQQILARREQPAAPTPTEPQVSPRQGAINYAEELDADPQLIARLEEDRRTAENARYQDGLKQAQGYEWRTLLHVDAPNVEREHPQLDKNSPDFHPALSNAVSSMYLQMSGYDEKTGFANNPGMRWGEFVESFWELADEIASIKTQAVQQQVARQASQTGLRPDGGTAPKLNLNKAAELMTDEELNAYLDKQGLNPKPRK